MSDVVAEAKKKAEKAREFWAEVYNRARDDLFFMSDEEGAQWNSADYERRRRKGRPVLTVDQLSQFINQVSNDIRMNTPSINVIPQSGGADIESAEIYQGMIRDIEQSSNADDAYDYAVNMAIKCGIGFIRVDHRYKDNNSFLQELFIQRVVNPLSVLFDADSIEPDGSDAKYAFIVDEISKDEFRRRYKGFNPVSFDADGKDSEKQDYVRVCEYFVIYSEAFQLAQLEDGSAVEYQEGMEGVVAVRKAHRNKVKRYKLSGEDVLEETDFPGKYIPIVPVYGEEAWRDGKRHLFSLIRKAKDSQRRYNAWCSTEAELLMKSPKSTVIAVGGTTEQYADDYLNPDKATVLRYDQTDSKGNPAPPPQVLPGPQIPAGVVNAMRQAAEDIKATMGLYNSFLGQRSNETSGVAIRQRKMEGDRAVFHFGDNLVKAIGQVGRILVCAIPVIYDTPQVMRVVGNEESSEMVGINGAMAEGQERPFYLAEGEYSVKVTTGASFATMREEAAEFFQQVIQTQPQLMGVAGDLLFKYMDFPGAQALSERMKKLLPPNLQDDQDKQDPQVMALQQENEQLKASMMAMQQESAQIQAQLADKQAEIAVKIQAERNDVNESEAKTQLEIARLRLDEQKIQMEYELKQAEIALKARELALKEQEAVMMASGFNAQPVMPQSGGI